jgi:hypothetical protein
MPLAMNRNELPRPHTPRLKFRRQTIGAAIERGIRERIPTANRGHAQWGTGGLSFKSGM